jgi:hypothetical protein
MEIKDYVKQFLETYGTSGKAERVTKIAELQNQKDGKGDDKDETPGKSTKNSRKKVWAKMPNRDMYQDLLYYANTATAKCGELLIRTA